jgi:predicted ester cyclase
MEEGDMAEVPRTTQARPARRAAAHAAWVTRLVEEACNEGDLAILDENPASPGARGEGSPAPLPLRQQLAAFRAAVPDARWSIEELVAAGETVVARLAVQGTFSGPLVGLARPGRPATLTGVAFARFSAGRLVELWLQADLLGFLQQLEVLPPLRLAQAVALAQVLQAAALLADELSPDPPDPPPRAPAWAAAAHPERSATLSRRAGGMSSSNTAPER